MCELKSCIVLQKINKTSGSLTEFRNNKHLHVFVLISFILSSACAWSNLYKRPRLNGLYEKSLLCCRPACAATQSDQPLCYSGSRKYSSPTFSMQNFNVLLCLSWADWFESRLEIPKAGSLNSTAKILGVSMWTKYSKISLLLEEASWSVSKLFSKECKEFWKKVNYWHSVLITWI